jgi:signal transduction histidine kinase
MDILKTSLDWAKTEFFASSFFILFGVLFLFASVGFWYLGKTEIAKSFIIPSIVVGIILMILGGGLMIGNKMRLTQFEADYTQDSQAFVESEILRSENTVKQFKVALIVMPLIIIICALLIMFIDKPIWRSSSITIIAMMTVLMFLDGTAKGRIEEYQKKLISIEKN